MKEVEGDIFHVVPSTGDGFILAEREGEGNPRADLGRFMGSSVRPTGLGVLMEGHGHHGVVLHGTSNMGAAGSPAQAYRLSAANLTWPSLVRVVSVSSCPHICTLGCFEY
jgi:hypothetical protein